MVNSEKTRVRLDNDERRKQLLELGRRLFGTHNYEELSISDIARLAGISKGLLYHYFPTKRVFYIETVREAALEMLRLTEPDDSEDPTDALMHSLRAYLDYVLQNASAYVSLLKGGVGVDPEVAAIVERVRRTLVKRIVAQLGAGKPTTKQKLALHGWVGFAEAVSLEWLEHRSMSVEDLAQFLANQLSLSLFAVGFLPKSRLALLKGLKGLLR